jgi:hypothetical protein
MNEEIEVTGKMENAGVLALEEQYEWGDSGVWEIANRNDAVRAIFFAMWEAKLAESAKAGKP